MSRDCPEDPSTEPVRVQEIEASVDNTSLEPQATLNHLIPKNTSPRRGHKGSSIPVIIDADTGG
jgi:hypothetical protein